MPRWLATQLDDLMYYPQVAGCMASKFRNAGQTCVSTNRFDCGLTIGLSLGFDLGFSTGLGLGLVTHSHL